MPIGTDREAREILEAEQLGRRASAAVQSGQPHVPAVYEHLPNESGYFFVAMEYLDGENLSDVIARGAVPAERAAAIAIELCAFLEAAHGFEAVIDGRKLRSLVHGDLKPQNVRITSDERGQGARLRHREGVVAQPEGHAQRLRHQAVSVARAARDDGEVDEFADLWAVGVMLYEMIRGARPFDAPDTQRLERIIRSRRPAAALTGRCPVGLAAIVARLLGPTPAERYESARAIREDLERFRSGATNGGRGARVAGARVDEEATRRARPEATRTSGRTSTRRRRASQTRRRRGALDRR